MYNINDMAKCEINSAEQICAAEYVNLWQGINGQIVTIASGLNPASENWKICDISCKNSRW